jgi:hypothetical protein
MNRGAPILVLTAIALLLVVWWWNRPTPPPPLVPAAQTSQPTTPPIIPPREPEPQPAQTSSTPLTYEVPAKGSKYQGMSDPRWQWWTEMEKRDSKFEWKMPIKFYGKVIDQNNEPVSGAKLRYGWNSVGGSNERFDQSDERGMFSLTGVQGKFLSVKVEKTGYHSAGSPAGQGFEYAAFFEPDYHEPDINNPVIFRLIKKQEAEPLVRKEQEMRLPQIGSVATVKLDQSTSLEIKLVANEINPDQPWSVQLTANGGSLQATTVEFPVEAPTDGYQSMLTIDRKSPKAPNWKSLYEGGTFFVKTVQGYAKMEIKMLAGDNRVFVTSYLNPTPGSRNLEYDPSKVVSSTP